MKKLSSKEIKSIAKEIIAEHIAITYYKITDKNNDYELTEKDEERVIEQLHKYCKKMLKAIDEEYITY